MMNITSNRSVIEAYLVRMLQTISRSGIRTTCTLRSVPALYDGCITALHMWLQNVGFTTGTCMSIIRTHGTTAEDMAGEMLAHLIRPERRVCRSKKRSYAESLNASLHPALDYILALAVDKDPAAAIRYLMRISYNFCVEKFRREREMLQKTVQTDPETLRHADAQATEAGAVHKHPVAADGDQNELLRRERMAAAFSCFDSDFLHDAALLSAALGMKRRALAEVICAGRGYALARGLVRRVNAMLGGDYTDAFTPFLRAARSFRLPEKYQGDMDALLRRLNRATGSDSRRAMQTRIVNAIA